MTIGVTGYLASGKDTVAQYLQSKNFHHYSLSDELRAILKERGVPSNRDNQVKVGNELREKYGADYLARRVSKKIVTPAVISSIRTPGEVTALKENKDFHLLFIDAPLDVRYQRIISRGREGQATQTFEEFKSQEEREMTGASHQQQLKAVADMADYIITNDSTEQEFYNKIDQIMSQLEEKDGN